MAVRELLSLPGLPRRVEDDLEEIKQLVRSLQSTEEALLQSSRDTNRQAKALETVVRQLDQALDHFRTMDEALQRVDRRLEAMRRDVHGLATAVADVAEHLPRKDSGPIAKAKDALSGGS